MTSDPTFRLIAELKSFRTRSRAANELMALGEAAVRPLRDALADDDLMDARWTIVNCLGATGSASAVPDLAALLGQGEYHTVAHEALVRMAGRDLGPTPRDWLRWAQEEAARTGGPSGESHAAEAALSDEELMKEAVRRTGADCRADEENRYVVDVPLGGGKSQPVSAIFGASDHEGAQIVIVYSDCGEADPEHYETVLRRNLRMPYGAVALRDIDGTSCFVVFNAILRHALSPVELRKSILAIGEGADRVRRQFGN